MRQQERQETDTENSPCAQKFLLRTITIANPDYILTLGSGLPRFFDKFMRGQGLKADVLHLPFPSKRKCADRRR